ncbi:MAG: nuclear transport factor 2 family protein [Bacteroidota bacterium]
MSVVKINIDDLKRDNWSDQELKNASLVIDFVQHLMNDHDFDYVMEKFGKNTYTQHNREMTDGITGVLEYIRNLTKRFPDYTYDVKHIYVDGQFVIFHSHATVNKKHRGNPNRGFNIKDTWKVVDGKIVEHWDAIQPINGFWRFFVWLTGGKVKNANTLY